MIYKQGIKVVTIEKLESTDGMIVAQKHLDARKPNLEGYIDGYVPGHGGDVWWVVHRDGSVGAYCYTELKEV